MKRTNKCTTTGPGTTTSVEEIGLMILPIRTTAIKFGTKNVKKKMSSTAMALVGTNMVLASMVMITAEFGIKLVLIA